MYLHGRNPRKAPVWDCRRNDDSALAGRQDRARSLTLLQGGEDDSPYRERLLSAYHGGQFGLYSQRMLRERDWKYVWNPTDRDELYDLEHDPGELTNLVDAPAHSERLGRMRRRLYEEFSALRDPLMKTHWIEHMLLDGVQ